MTASFFPKQPQRTWRDPSEWTGLNCSSASFGWFFLLGFLAVLSIKSGQQTGVQTYP
jgi:arginine exporter protein ArgO